MAQQSLWDWRYSALAVLTGSCFLVSLLCWSAADTLFALGLCFAALWIHQLPHARQSSLQSVIGTMSVALALLGASGSLIPATLLTTTQVTEAGQIINVVNYPLAYFAYRICTISALLGLSIRLGGARIDAQEPHGLFTLLVRMQAVLALLLYLGLLLEIYLDSTLPSALLGWLAWLWTGGWFVLAGCTLVAQVFRQHQIKPGF